MFRRRRLRGSWKRAVHKDDSVAIVEKRADKRDAKASSARDTRE